MEKMGEGSETIVQEDVTTEESTTMETEDTTSNQSETQEKGISAVADGVASAVSTSKGEWRSQLPPDLRNHPAFSAFANQKDVFRKFADFWNKENGANQKTPEKPEETEDDEEFKSVYDQVNSLSGHEKNMLMPILDLVKGKGIKGKEINAMFEKIGNENNVMKAEFLERQKEAYKKSIEKLWGDKAEENQNYLNFAKKNVLSDEALKNFEKKGLFNDPFFADLLAKYGKDRSEGVPAHSSGNKADSPMSLEDALFPE